MTRTPKTTPLFDSAPEEVKAGTPIGSNVPEFSVSEISMALKRRVETEFGHVRVRGEISQPKYHSSGHLYLTLKDENANLAAVCWRGQVAKLGLKLEEGMEVVAIGRLTTYPGQSKYQLVIESVALAGMGAILKMLEERKKKLAAEGLFDDARKKPLPFLPCVIGVITSPTGAVIQDILHRLAERFPTRVLLWPVAVQGENAAAQIAAAITGFNAYADNDLPKPDLLIVARGGGSVEDLLPFSEENVVRAAAASRIPLISAVGHETDTTLIDFASDRRAPTPTAAAEIAVPVRIDLWAGLSEEGTRLHKAARRFLEARKTELQHGAARLIHPRALIDMLAQKLDERAERLSLAIKTNVNTRSDKLARVAAGLSLMPFRQNLRHGLQRLTQLTEALGKGFTRTQDRRHDKLVQLGSMLESLSYQRTLARGFTMVKDKTGKAVLTAAATQTGADYALVFADGEKVIVVKEG